MNDHEHSDELVLKRICNHYFNPHGFDEPVEIDESGDQWTRVGHSKLDLVGICRVFRKKPHPLDILIDKVWSKKKALLLEFSSKLAENGVDFLILKGSEFDTRYYSDRPIALRGDIDILIKKNAMNIADKILYSMELRQSYIDVGKSALSIMRETSDDNIYYNKYDEPEHYALQIDIEPEINLFSQFGKTYRKPFLLSENGTKLIIGIGFIHNLVTGILVDEIWERRIPSCHGVGSTLHPSDHLFWTAYRYYTALATHNDMRIYKLFDIAHCVRSLEDWEDLLAVAKRYRAELPLYYVLKAVADLFKIGVPEIVISELAASQYTSRFNYGWQIDKNFQRIPRNPF